MFKPTIIPPRDEVTSLVCQMPYDSEATRLASKHGLNITTVSWEDNARNKNSSFGPCISDMTLNVNGADMPLIRASTNFNDETWDVEIEKIPLVVGNEDETMLRTVSLKEYLSNFRDYLANPSTWSGDNKSLLADDKHVICSSQACFLPMPKSGDAKFNVAIHNYQSSPGHPAVLAIVASANGTSAEIVDEYKQKLYFNKKGERASFIGQRLSDHRKETGSELKSDAPMTASEKQQNMLLIIQVPLKVNRPPPRPMLAMNSLMCAAPAPMSRSRCSAAKKEVDVEAAIIKVGDAEGPFREIGNLKIERDPQYPIRVTMQYYKATSNGAVDDDVMKSISNELFAARKWAVAISSLVTETTNRTTEHVKLPSVKIETPPTIPSWWSTFWSQYATLFPQYSMNDASKIVFGKNNKFAGKEMAECVDGILDILGKGPSAAPALPEWNVL